MHRLQQPDTSDIPFDEGKVVNHTPTVDVFGFGDNDYCASIGK